MANKAIHATTTMTLLLLSLTFAGCTTVQAAHVQVLVTDAPGSLTDDPSAIGDFQRLDVTFSAFKVHRAGTPGENDAPGSENEAGWQTFNLDDTIDLVALQNGYTDELLNRTLDNGRYTQVRFVVVKAEGILRADGSRVDVQVPDNQLRLNTPFDVQQGQTTTYTLDLHVVKQGVIGNEYKLTPKAGTVDGPR